MGYATSHAAHGRYQPRVSYQLLGSPFDPLAEPHGMLRPNYVPGGGAAGVESIGPRTSTSGRSAVRWGGGDPATDQAPMTCRPYAAQSVVTGGLRAHTRETASLSFRGGGRPCRKWSWRSASPPNPCPLGVPAACKAAVRACCAGHGTKGGDEDESRRHDT